MGRMSNECMGCRGSPVRCGDGISEARKQLNDSLARGQKDEREDIKELDKLDVKKKDRVKATSPRYDDVYYEGVAILDAMDK